MNDEAPLRDFIYLDVERVRSFVAQVTGGLTSELGSKDEEKTADKAQLQAGLPGGILKGTGGVDYHYVRTQSETKSLHDAIFQEFHRTVLETGHLIDLTALEKDAWAEDLFADGAFLVACGALKIMDYHSAARTLESLPKVEAAVARLSSLGQALTGKPTNRKTPRGQMAQLPIKDVTSVLDQFYGDTIRLKVFPFPSAPSLVLVGTADRSMFRYPPDLLANTYGMVIDAGWRCVLQVNRGVSYPLGLLSSSTGNQVEDSLEQMIDSLVGLNVIAQGIKFPAVAVTPIAIFRAV
jgi:hypothetical protein